MAYILLVEDDQNNADMMIRLLQSINIEVRHTLHGLEAAVMARKEHPVLILMDFNLPDIDGRTMVLQLKKQLGGAMSPPIVAVTARAGEKEKRLALQFGCAAFLSKPFAPTELLDLVKQLVPSLLSYTPPDKPTNAQP